MARRVLVTDDDADVRGALASHLRSKGFDVREATDGQEALDALRAETFALAVLDITMPGRDGLSVLRELRSTSTTPVLLLSGHGSEADRVVGLELGADDYVVKPFSPREVEARIEAILRRTGGDERTAGPGVRRFGELVIDPGARTVSLRGAPIGLTAKEFDLLWYLARSPNVVVSREELLRAVWGSSSEWQGAATVNEHIRRLRAKLGDTSETPRWVATSRGFGYKFVG